MNFRKTKRHPVAVEAASLSDILFFLLLFFLIVSTMASPTAIKLLLPKAQNTEHIPKDLINVSVNKNLEYFIEKQPTTFQGIEKELIHEASSVEQPTVVLRVDRSVQVSELVKVVDIINKLHLPMVLATEKPN